MDRYSLYGSKEPFLDNSIESSCGSQEKPTKRKGENRLREAYVAAVATTYRKMATAFCDAYTEPPVIVSRS